VCRVWSRYLVYEDVLAHWGLLRQIKKELYQITPNFTFDNPSNIKIFRSFSYYMFHPLTFTIREKIYYIGIIIPLIIFPWGCLWTAEKKKKKYIYIYTGCPGRNVPDFGRMFLKLKYTDLTKNTNIRSWTVTEKVTRETCDLLAVPRTVPSSRDVLPVHCACPSYSLQPAQAHSRCDCTRKVLGTLRTTATLVRVFM
jgi:hypothetical protein